MRSKKTALKMLIRGSCNRDNLILCQANALESKTSLQPKDIVWQTSNV